MMVCRTSGHGDCCDGRDVACGFRVHGRASVMTGGWSRDTAVCPGPAGSVWCRSSWVSSEVLPLAAEVWRTPAEKGVLVKKIALQVCKLSLEMT